jgi:prophage regulatory protein
METPQREVMERILRLPEVMKNSGLSRSSVYNQIRDGFFPRPVLLGKRAVGWRESEVAAMISARVRGAGFNELRALVAKLEADRATVGEAP